MFDWVLNTPLLKQYKAVTNNVYCQMYGEVTNPKNTGFIKKKTTKIKRKSKGNNSKAF